MKQDEILTGTQQKRVLAALRKLTAAPQVRDMIREVKLGEYPDNNFGGPWGRLSLTKRGLLEETGYYDKCGCPSDCSGDHDSYSNKPKVVKPSMRLVKEYDLREKPLQQLLVKLKS